MLAPLLWLAASLVAVGQPAAPIVLSDQYDHTWQLSDARGSVVVLIDGDQDGSAYNGAWGRALRGRYKGAASDQFKVVFVAHLTLAPSFMHGWVKGKFLSKDTAHPNGPILLDWKGAVGHQFGFRSNHCNVYVIDGRGVLRFTGSGQATATEVVPLFEVIDGLLGSFPVR